MGIRIRSNFVKDNGKEVTHINVDKYTCKRCNNRGHNFVGGKCGVCRSNYIMKVVEENG